MKGKNMNKKYIDDLGVSAYLLKKGFKVAGRQGREIIFSVPDGKTDQFDQFSVDYLSSEFHRFDSCIMSLKKIKECDFNDRNLRFVTDLGAAAYILMNRYKVVGRKGKAIYFEVDPKENDRFNETAFEYLSSDFHLFDSCLMSLKKIGEYISNN